MTIETALRPVTHVTCDECREQWYAVMSDDVFRVKSFGLNDGWCEVVGGDGDHQMFCPSCSIHLGLDEIK